MTDLFEFIGAASVHSFVTGLKQRTLAFNNFIISPLLLLFFFFFNTVYILGFKLLPESYQDPRVVEFDAIHSLRAKTLLKMCAVPISAVFWIS